MKPYASDLSDAEWAILEPLIPSAEPGGRPRSVDMRQILNGIFSVLRKPNELIVVVVTLLAFGCRVQAIVQAYGLDERTVALWRDRAGMQCQCVHAAS